MKKRIPFFAIIIAGVFWGLMSVFTKQLEAWGLPAPSMSCVRLSIAGILLWGYLLIFKRDVLKIRLKDLPLLLGIGAGSMFLMSVCYLTAITLTSASVSAILLYTSPVFIFIASVILFKEKVTKNKVIALVFAFLGCVLVSGIMQGGKFSAEGVLIGLASGFTYAMYSVFGTFALRRYSSLTVTAYAYLACLILSFIFVDYDALVSASVCAPSVVEFLLFCVLCACVTALAPFTLYTYGLQRMEASKAGILACIEPVVATLVGIFWLQEGADVYQIVGVLCVIGAIVFLELPKKTDKTLAKVNKIDGE